MKKNVIKAALAVVTPIKKGSIVAWVSQSQGYVKRKKGLVVAVVPAGGAPIGYVPKGYTLRKPGMTRKERSFLVAVPNKKALYWPLVNKLNCTVL